MPFSIDPIPGENEIECARCGAIIYDQLSRCPSCGVNLYEPEDEEMVDMRSRSAYTRENWSEKLAGWFRRVFRKPYSAEEVFGSALDQGYYYNDLLQKAGGDRQVVERLVEFERERNPNGTRISWLKDAIVRWQRDNRAQTKSDDPE